MKKRIYLFILLTMLFVPKVYAFSYDLGVDVVNSSDNLLQDIKVTLKDVQGSDFGIASCTLNITFTGDVKLNKEVRSLGSWTLTRGKFYLLDTGSGVKKNSDLLIIPVKVSGKGSVNIIDIECFDDQSSKKINNKSIDLKYIETNNNVENNNSNNISGNSGSNNTGNNNSNNDKDNVNVKDSNCDLSNITLSDGEINFDSAVTEYYLNVGSIDDLGVTPELASDKAKFTINKDNSKIVIDVVAEDGTKKVYTIFVENSINNNHDQDNNVDKDENKNNYTFIFIGIICVLVIINIVRIVMNKRRGELD